MRQHTTQEEHNCQCNLEANEEALQVTWCTWAKEDKRENSECDANSIDKYGNNYQDDIPEETDR